MSRGTFVVMRLAPRIGYPPTAPRIVSVAGRSYSLSGALWIARGSIFAHGCYWIIKAGQPAHRRRLR